MRAACLLLVLLIASPVRAVAYEPTGVVVGRVLDPDGNALAGLRVAVVWGFDGVETRSAADGSYRAEGVRAGPVSALAYPDRLASGTRVASAYACVDEAQCPVLAPGETVSLDIVLPWAAFLEGTVRDERGAPVKGAEVTPFFWNILEEQVIATTGPEGGFRFALMAGNYGLGVSTELARYLGEGGVDCQDDGGCVELRARETTWHNVTLPDTGLVTGILRGLSGEPIPNSFVELFDDRLPREQARMDVDTTDENGRFLLRSPREGALRLESSPFGARSGLCDDVPSPCVEVVHLETRGRDVFLLPEHNVSFATVGFPKPFSTEFSFDQAPAQLRFMRGGVEIPVGSGSAYGADARAPAGGYEIHITLRDENGLLYEGPVSCPTSPCLRLPLDEDASLRLVRTSGGIALEDVPAPPVRAEPAAEEIRGWSDPPTQHADLSSAVLGDVVAFVAFILSLFGLGL